MRFPVEILGEHMRKTMKTGLALAAVSLGAACSSTETNGPSRANGETTDGPVPEVFLVSVVREDDGFRGFVSLAVEGSPLTHHSAPLSHEGPFTVSAPPPPPNVPLIEAEGGGPVAGLRVGATVRHLREGSVQISPLLAEEAQEAVFVETTRRRGSVTLAFHLPPPEGGRRVYECGRVELLPALRVERILDASAVPPHPSGSPRNDPSLAEQTGKGLTTLIEGVGSILVYTVEGVGITILVVGAIVLAPIWIPYFIANPPHFSCGRPFRVSGKAETAGVTEGREWTAGTVPDTSSLAESDREELAREWLIEARAEHASIAAFSALSLDLLAVGAPPRLVEQAHRAALDEIVHARLCFALASGYAREAISPGAFPGARAARKFTSIERETARLAVESLQDGCLIEGFAANVAKEAQGETTDPAVSAALSVIVRDEARHEELAWKILEWCVEKGAGEEALRALASLPIGPSLGAISPEERPALASHGRFGRERFEAIFARTREAVVARATRLLERRAGLSCFQASSA